LFWPSIPGNSFNKGHLFGRSVYCGGEHDVIVLFPARS
jgi:hypothetical protein